MINTLRTNPFVQLAVGGLLLLLLDFGIVPLLFPGLSNRILPWYALHGLGIGYGILLLLALFGLQKINPLILGYVYLIMTFVELVIGFMIGQPLREAISGMGGEKTLFLIVFLTYLALQTYAATRILNRSEVKL